MATVYPASPNVFNLTLNFNYVTLGIKLLLVRQTKKVYYTMLFSKVEKQFIIIKTVITATFSLDNDDTNVPKPIFKCP